MAAPKGNTNAEKWTEELSHKLLDKALELCNQKDGSEYKYDFIGEIARELNTYHENITIHLLSRFPSLSDKVKLLKANMECNCYSNTKKGNIKEAIGIVNLKSNHHWTDRQKIEMDGTINIDRKEWVNGKEES
ncbi:hypothetical protein LCGC14_1777540 [marine sediment metagenome]|uniref:Uncharacterized protein n=1 Tax=marine sediment metagenome TaxID=412755 RepID=A0A0F9JW11_9ZZZZ